MFNPPSAFANWSGVQVLTQAASGPNQLVFNRMAHTGLIQFSHSGTVSGMVCSLQVRHLSTGSFKNWPCMDLSNGVQYAAGASITSADLRTLAFDARDVDSVQLTYASGAGAYFYWGWSAAPVPPQIHSTTVQHGKTLTTVSGLLTADTDVVAAVTGKRIKVMAYTLVTSGNTGSLVLFKSNGTSGTELWRVPVKGPSSTDLFGANLATDAPSFLFGTVAGEKLTMDVDSSAPIHYSLTYWTNDSE